MSLTSATIEVPVGDIVVLFENDALRALSFSEGSKYPLRGTEPKRLSELPRTPRNHPGFSRLLAYFKGDLGALDRIHVAMNGTPFQLQVWNMLRKIPAGTTFSYARLAREIGEPKAVRAVASANARNPVAIVVPCHRVIASDGKLCGYAGGIERKRWLLAHEGVLVACNE